MAHGHGCRLQPSRYSGRTLRHPSLQPWPCPCPCPRVVEAATLWLPHERHCLFKARAAEGAQEAAEKQARYLVITPMGGGGAGTLLSCHP
jgi:hypothetical protein